MIDELYGGPVGVKFIQKFTHTSSHSDNIGMSWQDIPVLANIKFLVRPPK